MDSVAAGSNARWARRVVYTLFAPVSLSAGATPKQPSCTRTALSQKIRLGLLVGLEMAGIFGEKMMRPAMDPTKLN